MQPSARELAQARATVYHALAESLVEPAPELPDTLLAAARIGGQVLDSASCLRAAAALDSLLPGGELNLRQQYTQVITPRGRRPIALYESLHRHGRLMGQAALEVELVYRGLGVAPAQGELPDHASVELAFLGSLSVAVAELEGGRSAKTIGLLRHEQHKFLRDHAAAWLPEVGASLGAGPAPFYGVVGNWLSDFLREEVTGRRRKQHEGVRRPDLIDPAACTLCGLCTGRCAAGALRILEDAGETCLMLRPEQCNGCGQCVAICPQTVLLMAAARPFGSCREGALHATRPVSPQVLRRDRRLACPRCGRPTVSQAEMDAVLAKLQLDASLQQRLLLCVACKTLGA